MVKCGEQIHMKTPKKLVKPSGDNIAKTVRATISFPSGLYESLEGIAKDKKVSLAWVVRDAVERYVGDKWPLFRGD